MLLIATKFILRLVGQARLAATLRPLRVSATLLAVRRSSSLLAAAVLAIAVAMLAQQPTPSPPPAAQQPAPAPTQPPPQQPAPAPQPTPAAPQRGLRVVVLDPAHGGPDEGAHGSGIVEKDETLFLARAVRGELAQLGLRVLMTRDADANPTFDERAAIANAQPGAVFVTLHISSTGNVGTALAYYFDFAQLASAAPRPARSGLLPWDEAQQPYEDLSRRLAELVQVNLVQRLPGSPELPVPAAVHQLRAIAAPAIAVELSSVDVPNNGPLRQAAPAVAAAVARAVADFRPLYEASQK